MDHGKLTPEKLRTLRVVMVRTVISRQVVEVTLNGEEDLNDAEIKAKALAERDAFKFIDMTTRYHSEQTFDITDELPDPPVIEI